MTTPEPGNGGGRRSFRYKDFALTLELDGETFRVRLLRSPYGGGEARFQLPFTAEQMERLLVALTDAAPTRGAAGQERLRHIVLVEPEAEDQAPGERPLVATTETIGRALFEALFSGKVLESFLLSLGQVESQEDTGLRILLVLDPSRPELAALCSFPWEMLHRPPGHYFARDVRTPVCRFLNVQQPVRALPAIERLRVLVAMANPADTDPLDLASERQALEETWSYHPGFKADFVEHAEIEDVYRRLRDGAYEVLHFMGHGSFEEGEGVLLFEDKYGGGVPVTGEVLGESLRGIRSLRLVFLNACQSAAFPRQAGQDPYTGVANALVLRGVPAVLAMQFPIADEAAIRFSGAFYSALAAGDPVDTAAAEGRLAIHRFDPDSMEWATPALFLNIPDGRLFAPREQKTAPSGGTPQEMHDPAALVWADLQPLFVEYFTPREEIEADRNRLLGGSLLFGRQGAWTGALIDGAYVLINDSRREEVKYFFLPQETLSLAEAPVAVEVKIESIVRETDLSGAGILYRLDPQTRFFYAFLLRPGQSYAFYRQDDQGFNLIYSERSTAIRAGEMNRLAMLGAGNSIHLYINEQRVKSIQVPPSAGDLVGIVALCRGRYRFDNFTLFQPLS